MRDSEDEFQFIDFTRRSRPPRQPTIQKKRLAATVSRLSPKAWPDKYKRRANPWLVACVFAWLVVTGVGIYVGVSQ